MSDPVSVYIPSPGAVIQAQTEELPTAQQSFQHAVGHALLQIQRKLYQHDKPDPCIIGLDNAIAKDVQAQVVELLSRAKWTGTFLNDWQVEVFSADEQLTLQSRAVARWIRTAGSMSHQLFFNLDMRQEHD